MPPNFLPGFLQKKPQSPLYRKEHRNSRPLICSFFVLKPWTSDSCSSSEISLPKEEECEELDFGDPINIVIHFLTKSMFNSQTFVLIDVV